MTREEAISHGKEQLEIFGGEHREFIEMAIKALEEPSYNSIKTELDDDVISRAELLKAIDTWDKFGFEHTGCFVREPKDDFITYVHYDDVIKCIKGMPSVNPQEQYYKDLAESYEKTINKLTKAIAEQEPQTDNRVKPELNRVKPELEPKTEGDCISRQEVLARIDAERKHLLELKMDGAEHIVVHHARRIIEDMPSVKPQEPKTDVLGKIRTEIDNAELPKNRMSFFRDGINAALEIIDKYRQEETE